MKKALLAAALMLVMASALFIAFVPDEECDVDGKAIPEGKLGVFHTADLHLEVSYSIQDGFILSHIWPEVSTNPYGEIHTDWGDLDLDRLLNRPLNPETFNGYDYPGVSGFTGFDTIGDCMDDESYSYSIDFRIGTLSCTTITKISDDALHYITRYESSEWAYMDECPSIELLHMPNLKYIGDRALMSSKIGDINAPNLEHVGAYAFFDNSLTNVHLPRLKVVEEGAFFDGNITNLDLPNLESAGNEAFSNNYIEYAYLPRLFTGGSCFKDNPVTTIYLPSLQTATDGMFRNCELTYIDVKDCMPALKVLGPNMFRGNPLTGFKLYGTDVSNYCFADCQITRVDSSDMPFVDSIGDYAFYGSPVSEIILDGITHVGSHAFHNCQLTSFDRAVDMPDIKDVGSNVFRGNPITSIVYDLPVVYSGMFAETDLTYVNLNNAKVVGDQAFEKAKLKSYEGLMLEEIGYAAFTENDLDCDIYHPYVLHVGANAFKNNHGLRGSLDLPMVERIDSGAFDGCFFHECNIPSVIRLGDEALRDIEVDTPYMPKLKEIGCLSLSYDHTVNVHLPELTSMADEAFSTIPNLTSVDLPKITYIPQRAFNTCYELTEVNIPNATSIGNSAFNATNLKAADMPLVTEVGDYAFSRCKNLMEVNLPDVTRVGQYAFENLGCTGVLNFPKLTYIGAWAFKEANISGITLSDEKTFIGVGAFSECQFLESIEVWTDTVPDQAFDQCFSLKDIKIKGLKNIGVFAFDSCAMTEFTAHDLESVGELAFSQCQFLERLDLSGAKFIDENAAPSNHALVSLDVSGGESIGAYAFKNCDKMTDLKITGRDTIGDNAFERCSSLTSVDLTGVKTLGRDSFSCCSLTTVDLKGVEYIGSASFDECNISTVKNLSAEYIGGGAFRDNPLPGFSIDYPVEYVGNMAFQRTGIVSFESEDCQVGEWAFTDTPLKYAVIGGDLMTGAFNRCAELEYVKGQNAHVESDTFEGCVSLKYISFPQAKVFNYVDFSHMPALEEFDLPSVVIFKRYGYFDETIPFDNLKKFSIGNLDDYSKSLIPGNVHYADGIEFKDADEPTAGTYKLVEPGRFLSENLCVTIDYKPVGFPGEPCVIDDRAAI